MKLFFILLVLIAGGFVYWKFEYSQKSNSINYNGTYTHVVAKGDTLYSLSRQYNTTVSDIKKLNNLENDLIHVGDLIRIEDNRSPDKSTPVASENSPRKINSSPKKIQPPSKPIAKEQLPESIIMENSNIGIDIDDKNQVYLKTKDGKFLPAGTIIYGSDADANGLEIKTITYRDLKGKETTLPGSADPESVIRLALKKQ